MQVIDSVEVDAEEGNKDDSPPELFEISTKATTGNDVVVLQESATGPLDVVLITAAPEAASKDFHSKLWTIQSFELIVQLD